MFLDFKKYLLIALLLCSLVGCSSKKNSTPDYSSALIDIRPDLLEVAKSVDESLTTLASTQKTKYPPVIDTAPLITPEGGMGHTTDIDWSGPVAPLLRKIADLTGYRLKMIGNQPPIPIVVSITKNNAVIADLIKDAGLQCGHRADIIVYPSNRVIELRYLTS